MKCLFVLGTLACLLLIIGAAILTSGVETAAQAAQATSTPTPEATRPGYTNYSGYYRIRCWPACHTMNLPESLKRKRSYKPTPTEAPYTLYSGYYRIRCWPACHTMNIPESIKKAY